MIQLKDENSSMSPPGDLDDILQLVDRVQSKRERLRGIGQKHKELSRALPRRRSSFRKKTSAVAPLPQPTAPVGVLGRPFNSPQRKQYNEMDEEVITFGKLSDESSSPSPADCIIPRPSPRRSGTLRSRSFDENDFPFVDEDLSSLGEDINRGGTPNGDGVYKTSSSLPVYPNDTSKRHYCYSRMREKRGLFLWLFLVLVSFGLAVIVSVSRTHKKNFAWKDADSDASSLTASDPTHVCFQTRQELDRAVLGYLEDPSAESYVARKYGFPIGTWCVSAITNFDGLFSSRNKDHTKNQQILYEKFDEPLDGWDMSSATSCERMFLGALSFNQDLSMWDVSSVENFGYMFKGCQNFDGDIIGWDTQNAVSLKQMFQGASKFNRKIGRWSVDKVQDMSLMFSYAIRFHHDLDQWDTSNVQHMTAMFANTMSFNGKIDTWNTSQVQSMDLMFKKATAFNQDISGWDMSSVSKMGGVLAGASNFDQDLCPWQDSLLSKRGSDINLDTTNLFSSSHGQVPSTLQLFSDSACPDPSTPTYLNGQFLGPFCHACS